MSNTVTENQSSNNQNTSVTEVSKQQLNNSNDGYTERQSQSAFQPSTVTFVFICCFFSCEIFSIRMLNKLLINFNH
jgi:hypothetical protein